MSGPVLSVVLVEDDPDEKEIFCLFLKDRSDLRLAEFFDDGMAMIESLQSRPHSQLNPCLIFLDQNMPQFNGYHVLQYLKKSGRYSSVPVVIYSTYVDRALEEKCLKEGALAVFTKPITAAGYNEMIDRIFLLLGPGRAE